MDQAKVVPTLKAIGDAAAATGKGSEGLNQVASAFGDMQIAGQLGMDQINRLQSAGVPALKILANTFGISTDAMKKKISSGSVDSVKAIDQLVEGMQKGTKGLAGETAAMAGIMEETKKNWTGAVDSLKSSISSTMATIMEPAKPHIQNAMAWFGKTFTKLPPVVFGVANMVKPAFLSIGNTAKSVASTIKTVTQVFQGIGGNRNSLLSLQNIGLSDENAKKALSIIKNIKNNFTSMISGISASALSIGNTIGAVFSKIAPYAKQGLMAIVSVVKTVVSTISEFWHQNGAQIIQAVKNIAIVIGAIFKVLGPVLLFLIKTIWGNIKGVIQGGLNFILGLVKMLASLFTGDWAGLWQGVKQLFFGAIQFLWNLWNLMMMGRLVKGAAMIVKSIAGFFKGLGPKLATNVQYYYHLFMDKFYQIGIGILRSIGGSVGKIVGVARNAVSNFIQSFQLAKTFGISLFDAFFVYVTTGFRMFFGTAIGFVRSIFSSIATSVSGFIGIVRGFISNLWINIQTTFLQIYTAMTNPFTSLSGVVQTVVSSVSSLVRGLFTGVTASGRGAINGLVMAANAMIGGINKLSFTVPDWVPKLGGQTIGFSLPKIPMLAQGGITTGATLAMIGEGAEQEAVLPLSKLQALLNFSNNKKSGGDHYEYNPTYIIQGNANKKEIEQTSKKGFEDFKRWSDEKKADDERLKFK